MITIGDIRVGLRKAGIAVAAVIAVMLLVACSSGGDAPEDAPTPPTDPTASASKHEIPVMLSMSAASFDEWMEEQAVARRATQWKPPTDYFLYDSLYNKETYVNLPNLGQSTIDLFMTHDNASGDATTTKNPLHARLRYSPSATTDSKWKLVLPNDVEEDSVKQGNYYAYGFVPNDAADSASIAKLPKVHEEDPERTWAEGAILTIHGLKTVATDPCIIIGAKHGPDADHCDNLKAGDFQFYLNKTGNPPTNYLYFLFDHLYSAFSISMRVHGTYHALRHIKLKAMYLQTEATNGTTPSKANVTITLNNKNNTNGKPIVESISFAPADNTPTDHQIYSNPAGFALTDEFSMFLGHFMPNSVSKLILTSVYDVYDKDDKNLIRKDCRATNTMLLSTLFNGQEVSTRGWKYKVRLTINPTYLYVMSDPDLDNPSVSVE